MYRETIGLDMEAYGVVYATKEIIYDLTAQMAGLRRQMKLCEDIAERCGVIEMVVNEIERGQIAEKKKPAEKKKCEKGIDI